MILLDLQRALAAAGFDPGPLDGIAGPKTHAAINGFQAAQGLVVDGIAGPLTWAGLNRGRTAPPAHRPLSTNPDRSATPDAIPAALPWLAEGKRLIGLAEGPGPADNPAILAWANEADVPFDRDETPWCGLFIAHCFAATVPDEPLPANLLGARQWLRFGVPVAPQLGAILVFWRGSRDGWAGHVALYWAEDATSYHVLGGNQSDAVTITKIAKSRFLGARWPASVAPLGLIRRTDARRILSTNEA